MSTTKSGVFLHSKKKNHQKNPDIKSNLAAAYYPAVAVEMSGRCKGRDSELLLLVLIG